MLVGVYVHTETYTRMFTAALFINAQNLETTTLSWVNGHINLGTSDNGILSRAEKNEHSNHGKTCAVKVKDAQSCPTLCGPMDHTVHGILQTRILEWVAIPFSRGSFQPRDQTQVSNVSFKTAVSKLFRTRDCFHERQFFHGLGEGWYWDDK